MSDLRIGAFDLEPKDVAYIRALVRLFSHTEKLGWSFAEHPPYHAVVADHAARRAHPAFFERFKGLVLTMVAPPGVLEANTVAYPIRANQFRDWLKLRQTELLGALYHADDPAAGRAGRAEGVQVEGERSPGAPAIAPPSTVAQGERRFKLRRWPAAGLLQGDPMHMRIATLMSRNAMSSIQLAELTGQPEGSCRRFVQILNDANLLIELTAVDGAPSRVQSQEEPSAAKTKLGLMASLRRRLGL